MFEQKFSFCHQRVREKGNTITDKSSEINADIFSLKGRDKYIIIKTSVLKVGFQTTLFDSDSIGFLSDEDLWLLSDKNYQDFTFYLL